VIQKESPIQPRSESKFKQTLIENKKVRNVGQENRYHRLDYHSEKHWNILISVISRAWKFVLKLT